MNEKILVRDRRSGSSRAAALLLSGAMAWASASAQIVKAPRYQGGVNAPVKQVNLPPLPAAITPHGTVVEDVVVRVNDQIISRSDVDRAQTQMAAENAQGNISPADAATREKDMLRDMIDQQLLLSRAKELGLNADAEVVRRLDDIRKQNKLDSMDDLEKAARQQGVSFEDYKAQIRNQILTQQVVRDEVGRRLQMTQGEESRYYEEHKAEFDQPEQIQLSEILVPLPETATAAEIAQAEAKANVLKSKVAQGQDFAELAKKSSGGPSAAQGGELGMFKRGALAKVLEDQTFSLKPGESTQPIRTRQGFVILKVTEHAQAGPAPLKEVEPQVQEALYMQAMQPALRAYLTRLREESYVDLQPGFVDSGASARETKPVFTAYAPPPSKKKKVKDKARFDRHGGYTAVSAPVVSSPDTTGGRTLTGPEAKPLIDPNTGLATLTGSRTSSGKQKHVRREKVRFGQAPRNALPAAPEEAAVSAPAADGGAAGASGSVPTAAPGAVMLPVARPSSTVQTADVGDDPLAPKAPERKKTRFSAKSQEVKDQKLQALSVKQQEKIAATPAPITGPEEASAATQAAPLGLAGDTGKKQKKVKKAKGAPKERLEEKKKPAAAAPAEIAPTANPALAPTAETGSGLPQGTAPKADTTTLPPATAPAQGAPVQGPGTPQQQPQTPGAVPPTI